MYIYHALINALSAQTSAKTKSVTRMPTAEKAVKERGCTKMPVAKKERPNHK